MLAVFTNSPNGSSTTACGLCPAGTYGSAAGLSACAACAAGTYQTGTGLMAGPAFACAPCGPGTYQTAPAAVSPANCSLCAAGTYGTGTAVAAPAGCAGRGSRRRRRVRVGLQRLEGWPGAGGGPVGPACSGGVGC